ncbi:caspase domain protein [Kordia sp. SMS9]|uniref:caspase family protein n=1 Tax=Kordia sp. SMS9 TaxID=2282170 RepID=UPI000E0CC812|nr:caspase family protein [Kordia sp. SMS9]AXG68009.1 caspase domain protein [Kordia sp. SMS9]
MRRALLVGINHYQKSPLKGCIPDAERMLEVISRHENGDPNFDCKLLISNPDTCTITIPRLKNKIYDLFNHEADVAFFFFAGHGASTHLGSYLVTEDAEKHNEGVSLSEVVNMANNSKATEVIIILDCCHSGGIGNFAELGDRKVILREGVSLLTASRDTQYSMERGGFGVFTTIIYDALKGGAADILGKVNVARMYNYVDIMLDSWKQRPIFKSHVSKMIPLRNCTPKIASETLRKLPKYFNDDKKGIQLSADYILGEEAQNGLANVMSDLRQYHANGLLLPTDAKSLDEAAKNGSSCVLTPLGIYYKELAKTNRI